MAEIVITGGQGFLGRHLTKKLTTLGRNVCSTYNYTLPACATKPNLSFQKVDVIHFDECLKLINQENPKIVIHLVAQPIVTAAVRHPFPTEELTIRGSYNILEAIRQTGNPTLIIYFSTDKVYGNNKNATEDSPLAGVEHPYNASKVCGDVIAQMYCKSFGLPVSIVRSANIYGGGDFHWDRLVPGISRQILHNEQPVLRSSGRQIRDYIYIDDLMDAFVSMIDTVSVGDGTPLNLGAETPFTSTEIVDKLLYLAGRVDLAPKVLDGARDEIDAQHIVYDKAKELLGWIPHTSIDEGLEKTLAWYKDWFSK